MSALTGPCPTDGSPTTIVQTVHSVLSRYAPGGGLSRFDLRYYSRYPGTQPYGDYPIQIIVKGGRTTLLGVVDSEFDKRIAGVRAREVFGTFGVENELVVLDAKGR